MHGHPSELPHAAAARRLWIGPESPHQKRLGAAAPWVSRWQGLARGSAIAIAWDGSDEAATALWVATRLGLSVTAVSSEALPTELFHALDDQSVTYGGSLCCVRALADGQPVVRPAA